MNVGTNVIIVTVVITITVIIIINIFQFQWIITPIHTSTFSPNKDSPDRMVNPNTSNFLTKINKLKTIQIVTIQTILIFTCNYYTVCASDYCFVVV